jgi:DNA ligase-1
MTTLYKLDSKEKIRQWTIREDGTGIYTSDGIVGGKIKDEIFKKAVTNQQFKTQESKAKAMMQAAIDKKLRSNYFSEVVDIKKENILFMPTGCPSGMIWEEWKNKKHVVYPALASSKLDGSKMYSTWRENRVFLNTRSAKEHKNFRHIEEALKNFYKEYPNIVLDGEAYNHEYAERFEELQSIFRKQKPTEKQRALSAEVAKFYIYDIVNVNNQDMKASDRQSLLAGTYLKFFKDIDCIVHWPSVKVRSEEEYDAFHEQCMEDGFEGTVLKIAGSPYVQRKNKNVMKRKPKFDCEFTIVDVIEGEGTNAGLAGKIIFDLTTSVGINDGHKALLTTGVQDAGFAKGWNHDMKKEVLENKADYIGKIGTFEYGGITAYGKLRFSKFKAVRTD